MLVVCCRPRWKNRLLLQPRSRPFCSVRFQAPGPGANFGAMVLRQLVRSGVQRYTGRLLLLLYDVVVPVVVLSRERRGKVLLKVVNCVALLSVSNTGRVHHLRK